MYVVRDVISGMGGVVSVSLLCANAPGTTKSPMAKIPKNTGRSVFLVAFYFDWRTNKSDRDYRFVPQLVQNISSAEILDPHSVHLSDLDSFTFGLSTSEDL